ncbi:thiol:disulfide interchange protein [Halalkalibacillus sediminis]|uniref:Thiol:disulfide interchange protein n=1 Tax=Halalkalibacillus sediminis TaxID=2018042 RepID=A0A2I0QWJ9_9BACI|nr:redoxin domain-containing protein [Halalkalibacillus sediminis]PKR78727.1 thiol:disulfide interchange protein [Halalkalibacillus sediminis]
MLFKRLIALGIILTLGGIIVYNVMAGDQEQEEEGSESGAVFVVPEGMEDVNKKIEIGEAAPNFQLTNMDGDQVELNDFKGKKVLLNFWASWCGPCRAEMPHMQDIHEKYGDEVAIVGVNVTGSETSKKDAVKFVGEYDLTFPILFDETNEVSLRYKALSLPTTHFINTEGVVQLPPKSGAMSYEEMEKKIEQLD